MQCPTNHSVDTFQHGYNAADAGLFITTLFVVAENWKTLKHLPEMETG